MAVALRARLIDLCSVTVLRTLDRDRLNIINQTTGGGKGTLPPISFLGKIGRSL